MALNFCMTCGADRDERGICIECKDEGHPIKFCHGCGGPMKKKESNNFQCSACNTTWKEENTNKWSRRLKTGKIEKITIHYRPKITPGGRL